MEGYGLTEASPITHTNPIFGDQREGSIGLPMPGVDAFVAGEQAAQQPGKHTDAESDSSRETGRDAP